MRERKKTRAQLEGEIRVALQGEPSGGGGGGGRRGRLLPGSSVVLPHRRTSPTCKKCGQFHTQAEHRRHSPTRLLESSTRADATKKRQRPKADPLMLVLDAVSKMPSGARYGQDVFIYPLWKKVGKKIEMSLDEFKRWLIEQNRLQRLALVRADLVDDMDPSLVERSEIEDLGAQFHFVVDPRTRRQRASSSSPRPARTLLDDVATVKQAIRSIHGAGRFGDRKVFISELWRRVGGELGLSLDEFKRWIVARHRAQDLRLARADFVSAMDPRLVAASETFANPGESYPVFHFAIDESV